MSGDTQRRAATRDGALRADAEPGRSAEGAPAAVGRDGAIGFFDSGVGGLSVWREVVARLPRERTVYIADNAHCPYGRKSVDELVILSQRLAQALLAADCKLIVVACNTATAAAIGTLRARFSVPFVGMEPAVKPAALNSRSGVIGVLATEGTFNGRLFRETSARFAAGVREIVRVGDGLVELVEAGRADSDEARVAVEAHVRPMVAEGIDHLVLGCTHFPFLMRHIRAAAGPGVTVLDPAPAVARQVEHLLAAHGLLAEGGDGVVSHRFAATGDATVLRRMVEAIGWRTRDAAPGFDGLGDAQGFLTAGIRQCG
jgi:glutamate racemase